MTVEQETLPQYPGLVKVSTFTNAGNQHLESLLAVPSLFCSPITWVLLIKSACFI